jgi:excisionase family DNA binding protein
MNELLTIEEAAAKLKVTPKTVRNWIREGKIVAVKMGRFWRVTEEDLLAFVNSLRSATARDTNERRGTD